MMEQRHWQQQGKCRNITFQWVNTYQTSTESLKESHVNKTEIEFTLNTNGKVTITLRDGYGVRLRREQAIVLGFMNFEDSAETVLCSIHENGIVQGEFASRNEHSCLLQYCTTTDCRR